MIWLFFAVVAERKHGSTALNGIGVAHARFDFNLSLGSEQCNVNIQYTRNQ